MTSAENILLDAGVYPAFLRSKLSDYRYSPHIQKMVYKYFKYIENYGEGDAPLGHGIYFHGYSVKSGADMLINLIVKKALYCGHTARILSFEEIMQDYTSNRYMTDSYEGVTFLAITGIGLSSPNTMEKKVLTNLLWNRYYNNHPFCFLSSVSVTEGEQSLLNFFGEEIAEVVEQRCLVLDCAVSNNHREETHSQLRRKIFG